jgi:deoxyribodipyrimidine photolyase-related protein
LNLHRLVPRDVLNDVLDADIPLNSKEGFVRQVLGWREFVRLVHRRTDGFRSLPGGRPCRTTPGRRLPVVYWNEDAEGGTPSGLACLDHVVRDVWREAWAHHIPRLMVLANIATLLDVSPRELTDWFWVAFDDAYDWVVEPNVLGMGTFAVGEVMTTKPYISGSGYVHRMSDFCSGCAFHPKRDCPLTSMYWAYLARHETELSANSRMARTLAGLRRRSSGRRERDRAIFEHVSRVLAAGAALTPSEMPA